MEGRAKKPVRRAGPRGFQKKPSKPSKPTKSARTAVSAARAKGMMKEMSEAQQKRAILQMLQGKTPAFMKKLK